MQQLLITIYNEIDLVILVIIEFTLLLSGGILILLVLGDEIVHVGLRITPKIYLPPKEAQRFV